MKPIIKVKNLSKQYRIGSRDAWYGSLRESLVRNIRAPLNRFRQKRIPSDDTLWALKDINFEASIGELVGIIGRNGAGKSTLLKVLSRVTEPTKGKVELYGRVASLLEVGTGFHPELTGRENIFLSSVILGMTRIEMRRHFDEIVAFAGIEKFLDTPVKRYSTGMYTRLAFAVAAHVESEILLVDEVLAVGDAEFQKKCLGKMEEVGARGRTVFFVSHSIPMILRLCQRVLLLHEGKLIADGSAPEVTRTYLHTDIGSPASRIWPLQEAPGDSIAKLRSARVLTTTGVVSESIDIRLPFFLEVEYWHLQTELRVAVVLQFFSDDGACLFTAADFTNKDWWSTPRGPGVVTSRCTIPGNFFSEGNIFVLVCLCSYNPNIRHAIEADALSFQVIDQSEGDGSRGVYEGEWPGLLRPMLSWKVKVDADIETEAASIIGKNAERSR